MLTCILTLYLIYESRNISGLVDLSLFFPLAQLEFIFWCEVSGFTGMRKVAVNLECGFPGSVHLLYWNWSLTGNLKVTRACKDHIGLCLPNVVIVYTHHHAYHFHMGTMGQTEVSMLGQKVLYWLIISSVPHLAKMVSVLTMCHDGHGIEPKV